MHRFRKKSDTKRSQLYDVLSSSVEHQHLPELPPASNFRTSLILPDLSRRFTLLRTSSGDPVSLDDLRARFAEQRARGGPNRISEEEENMILETLGRLRAKNASTNERLEEEGRASRGDEGASDYQPQRHSRASNTTSSTVYPASTISSPSSRSTKRYSNNLFGSGRFRDYSYIRSVSSQRTTSNRSFSITPTDSSHSLREKDSSYTDSLRPLTPEGSGPPSSVPSSPNEKTPVARSVSLISSSEESAPTTERNFSKALNTINLQHASLALESVIKELEEEAEDEIVMPRTAHPIPRAVDGEQSRVSAETSQSIDSVSSNPDSLSQSSSEFEAGTAISSDRQMSDLDLKPASPTPYGRPGTVSPTPRLPGYIPGMPRPMTPRDTSFDSDDQSRAHSATPRAMSPILPAVNGRASPLVTSSIASSLMRRDSNASRQTPRPQSPAVSPHTSKSGSGRFTPEDGHLSGDGLGGADYEGSVTSSILGRLRPASPLSGQAYQLMSASPRPGTPSNVTWNVGSSSSPPKDHGRKGSSVSGHSKNDSGGLDRSIIADFHGSPERAKSSSRSLRSPALPDSPLYNHTSSGSSTWNRPLSPDYRPSSSMSGVRPGSPMVNRSLRSPTPTQSRSPTSPSFSHNDAPSHSNTNRRSSKKNHNSQSSLGQPQALVFSPLVNSSRSSLESAGSSYHSWEDEHKKARTLEAFSDTDNSQPTWHDIGLIDKSSSATPADSQDDNWDAEDIIRRYAGLTTSDFVAIQEKLVGAAVAKATHSEVRERVPSLRRRRPSTSQSNYSLNGRDNRVASPPPQYQNPSLLVQRTASPDNSAKASALLDSVVDSIHPSTERPVINVPDTEKLAPPSQTDLKISPTTRRNRDLARALFGSEEKDEESEPSNTRSPDIPSIATTPAPETKTANAISLNSPSSVHEAEGPPFVVLTRSPLLSPQTSAMRSPHTPVDNAELTKEVQRKTEVAMAALKKSSASQKFSDLNASSVSVTRKRITPNQISTPRLVSATTSVDTIPLPPPSSTMPHGAQGPLNITQRIRRLRGTLRAKPPAPTGDEVTPFPMDLQPRSAPVTQTTHIAIPVPIAGATPTSPNELSRLKSPIPSPPASATPGIKGFMARFRKPRTVDFHSDSDRNGAPHPSPTASSSSTSPHHVQSYISPGRGLAANAESFSTPPSTVPLGQSAPSGGSNVLSHISSGSTDVNDSAVKQLFEAASNLGLDRAALDDLLARSTSVSSKSTGWTMLTRNNSALTASRPNTRQSSTADRARSPMISEGRPSIDEVSEPAPDESIIRKLTVRKQGDTSRPRQQQAQDSNPVVRRTIIFPSEAKGSHLDLSQLLRKGSQSNRRRRSASAASVQSGRSVHDRAPTPPPPRSPGGRRFSSDNSPPVPQIPTTLSAQAENLLHAPQNMDKSTSAYDSLYDMYAGENRNPNTFVSDVGGDVAAIASHEAPSPSDGGGAALELIEMANGETIWSIVNGLRDDDVDSIYANRTSFASEYSTRENGDGVQVFVREHARSTSKGSNTSFLSRKKPHLGKSRPDTKVFYSSSTQIGRLIENLSQGMDSGSFNFVPNLPPGHSTPSSFHSDTDMHWTVEERLEHMLGSMKNP